MPIEAVDLFGAGDEAYGWFNRVLRADDRRFDIWTRLRLRSSVVHRGYETPCFEWQGPDSGKGRGGGYGRMCLNDTTCAVHKVAWTNEHGYIPPKKQIDHKCTNRLCWRPDHLELVSASRNQRRKVARRSKP